MTVENGAATSIERPNDSARLAKKRRNGRKNGGAKIWAAACDELHACSDADAFEPGTLVWARVEEGFWWPAFVPSSEVLPLSVLRRKQDGWICVKYYDGNGDCPTAIVTGFAWLEPKDIVLYHDESDVFCQQVIPEAAGGGNFQAALIQLQRARSNGAEGSDVAPENPVDNMGKLSTGGDDPGEASENNIIIDKEEKLLSKKRKASQDGPEDDAKDTGQETDESSRKRIFKLKITRSAAPQEKLVTTERRSPSRKTMGTDGSYFECMVCDSGGNLLCCDHCPRVYHLHCLSPPLKRAPSGKWRCPNCKEAEKSSVENAKVITPVNTEAQEKASDEPGKCKQASNGDILNVSSEKTHKRSRDDMIKRFKKKAKLDDRENAAVDKCPPCGLNKQSSEIVLDAFGSETMVYEEEETASSLLFKKLPSCGCCGNTGGSLLKCNRCSKYFHLICLDTPFKKLSKSRWICSFCSPLDSKKRKEDPLIHNAGPLEVDRILGCRSSQGSLVRVEEKTVNESTTETDAAPEGGTQLDVESRPEKAPVEEVTEDNSVGKQVDGGGSTSIDSQPSDELEYLVKWVGKSHIHNDWISESRLKSLAKRKLENYKAKHGTVAKHLVDDRWIKPQRIIARRKGQNDAEEVLVKWSSLPYDECTWERLDNTSIIELQDLLATFLQFEREAIFTSEGRKLKDGQSELEVLKEQPIELQGGMLFPHQMEALNWLRKCWHKKKNVILADEMGLGKTISACAFLSSLHHEFKVRGPCLVLVPLSTMPNWMAEFSLWAPGLNVIEYHGSVKARAVIRQYEWYPSSVGSKKQRSYKFKVMLTNYETVINDPAPLRGLSWEVLVVDEGHRLKNSGSKLFNLLNTFTFAHRVLMTGTPMQNNLGEMYNLLNFLQPEKFPSLVAFQESFTALSTAEQVEEIRKLVAPHMLRRLKKDAMQGIPPKAERVVLVELSSVQAEYYRALLTKNFQLLRQGTKSQQSMINIIMQLRKVCNHPYLIPGTEPECGTGEFLHEMRIKASAKLTLLHTMLGALKKDGHRVLIFSQMTKLLDILEDYLTFEFGHESYERVDGSVPVAERQAAIRRFNKDNSRFVFLLSTRSCGLGINLATADTVVIYDSDFNPHADIQAMNRAHRIGQSKKLLVYRLLVRGSVEERILHLAKKKLELEQLFASKSGSQKEIEDILQWGTEELFGEPSEKEKTNVESPVASVQGQDEKPKKKVGGLGDVYNDKCHEAGRSKVIWDDAAIKRLLDRSSIVPDATEGDGEGDMLGSIKAWDSNEQEHEATEEHTDQNGKDSGPNDLEPSKPDNEGDNKWERLLRIRWEKLQSEEEAVLGRGKRQRKVISYNECAVQKSKDVSSDSEEMEAPEPDYTPAGQALKQKLAKLRARQKARIALRYAPQTQHLDGLHVPPFLAPCLFREAVSELKQSAQRNLSDLRPPDILAWDLLPSIGGEPKRDSFPLPEPVDEALMQKALASRLSKMSEGVPDDRVPVGDLNLFPGSMPPSLPDGVSQGSALRNLLPPLPPRTSFAVSQGLPVHFENPSRSFLHGPFGSIHQPDVLEGVNDRPRDAERKAAQFPGDIPPLDSLRKLEPVKSVDLNKDAAAKNDDVSQFQGVQVPPKLEQGSSNLSMSLTLGMPPIDRLPFGEMAPRLDPTRQPLPDFIGGRPMSSDSWTEDELDALWIGVRRHGRGNWMGMLQDPKLCFSKRRTVIDLAERWQVEEAKFLGQPGLRENIALREPDKHSKPKRDRRRHRKDSGMGRQDHAKFSPGEFRNKASFRSGSKELSKLVPNFADFNFPGISERPNLLDRSELSSHLSSVLDKLHETPPNLLAVPPPSLPNINFGGDGGNWSSGAASCRPPLPPPPPPPPKGGLTSSTLPQTEKPSTLPHWLKDAFSVAPAPEEASLSPHVAAVSQAVSILHKNQKPLLAAWTHSWHPLVPPRELPKRKKRKKRGCSAEGVPELGGESIPPAPPANFLPGVPVSGTHFQPVQLPSFSFSRSLLEPLPFPPVPLLSSDPDLKHRTSASSSTRAAPFFPELFPTNFPPLPSFRPKFFDGQTGPGSTSIKQETVPQFLPPPPPQQQQQQQQRHSFGSSKKRRRHKHKEREAGARRSAAAELPPWMVSAATLPPAAASRDKATVGGAAARSRRNDDDGDASSDTHSDPEIRNNERDDEVDDVVSSEGTVSDDQR